MFLPMSCTSPFTVASSTLPLGLRTASASALRLDVGHQVRHRLLHDPRALHDLRQEHLARRRTGRRRRSCPSISGPSITWIGRSTWRPRLLRVLDDVVGDALHQRVRQPLLHGRAPPGEVGRLSPQPGPSPCRRRPAAARWRRPPVEHHVLHQLEQVRRDVGVDRRAGPRSRSPCPCPPRWRGRGRPRGSPRARGCCRGTRMRRC